MDKIDKICNLVDCINLAYCEKNRRSFVYYRDETLQFKDLVKEYGTDEIKRFFKPLHMVQYKNYLLLRYDIYSPIFTEHFDDFFSDSFEDGLYSECRSLVIDLERVTPVLVPYTKFRGVNECTETSREKVLQLAKKVRYEYDNGIEFANKLDGSMVLARWYNGEMVISTSRSLNPDTSWRIQVAKKLINQQMLKVFSGKTFIFELIHPEDVHIVQYKTEDYGLHLIGIRDCYGERHASTYINLARIARDYDTLSVDAVKPANYEEFVNYLDIITNYNGCDFEGCVLHIGDKRFKVKTSGYLTNRANIKHALNPNELIKAISDGYLDDVYAAVPISIHKEIDRIVKPILEYRSKKMNTIRTLGDEIKKNTEGLPFAEVMKAVNNCPAPQIKEYIRKYVMDGEDSINVLKNLKQTCYLRYNDIN
jgi:hypothetical protein